MKKSGKKTDKLAAKVAEPSKVKQPHGGALLTGGVPGHKGGGGRPPNWLRDFCDERLADPKCKAQVEAILNDKKHPAFAAMWKAVGDRAHGKPRETVKIEGLEKLAESMAVARARVRNR